MTDELAPAAVEPLLRGRLGRPYAYRRACESTQLLLGPDLAEGAVAVCEEQTAGRGRLGRSWEAPPGTALLVSVLLRPPAERRAPELSLVGGLAVAETVEAAIGRPAGLKWPNDVLVDGRKVAGVLAEARGAAVVLGIGLNVNQAREELPPGARVAAASLLSLDGVRRPRAPLLVALLERLEQRYDDWRDRGLDGGALAARDVLRGRRIRVDGLSGTALGIDPGGRLELEVDGERQLVESGEATVDAQV